VVGLVPLGGPGGDALVGEALGELADLALVVGQLM
jgi:hypothetical protein